MGNIVKAAVSFDPVQADVDIARIQFEQSQQRLIQATAARRIAELDAELQGVILGMREYGATILAKERGTQIPACPDPDLCPHPVWPPKPEGGE